MFIDLLSGLARSIIGYPFDIVRYNLQTQPYKDGKGIFYNNSIDCAKKIGVRGLYKGILPFSIGNSLLVATHFQVYRLMEDQINTSHSYLNSFISGSVGGLCGNLINTPMEHIRIKLTKRDSPHMNSYDIFRKLIDHGGIRMLYKGILITAIRDSIGYGSFFVSKKIAEDNISKKNKLRPILVGIVSGFGLWLSMFPLDTIKTNIQFCSLTKTKNIHLVFNEIYKTGGIKNFYKGLGPCLARAIPVNIAIVYINNINN